MWHEIKCGPIFLNCCNKILKGDRMVTCDFKATLLLDENISVSGRLNTDNVACPIKWIDYGLRWFFPNNPYDPLIDAGRHNRFEKLRKEVLNDKELLPLLVKYADEKISILQDNYIIDINGGD